VKGGLAAFARSFGEILLQLTLFAVAFFGFGEWVFFAHDDGPHFGILAVEFDPFFRARIGIGADGIGGAFGLADAAIDAFVGVDDQHILALVEAIYRANLDAVGIFAGDAGIIDDVGHS
jgi:hypothetical protein